MVFDILEDQDERCVRKWLMLEMERLCNVSDVERLLRSSFSFFDQRGRSIDADIVDLGRNVTAEKNIQPDQNLCPGSSVVLLATPGVVKYPWIIAFWQLPVALGAIATVLSATRPIASLIFDGLPRSRSAINTVLDVPSKKSATFAHERKENGPRFL